MFTWKPNVFPFSKIFCTEFWQQRTRVWHWISVSVSAIWEYTYSKLDTSFRVSYLRDFFHLSKTCIFHGFILRSTSCSCNELLECSWTEITYNKIMFDGNIKELGRELRKENNWMEPFAWVYYLQQEPLSTHSIIYTIIYVS